MQPAVPLGADTDSVSALFAPTVGTSVGIIIGAGVVASDVKEISSGIDAVATTGSGGTLTTVPSFSSAGSLLVTGLTSPKMATSVAPTAMATCLAASVMATGLAPPIMAANLVLPPVSHLITSNEITDNAEVESKVVITEL